MMKKTLKFFAKYVLMGILPSAILSILVKKLEDASRREAEHADEVLLDSALVSIIAILTLGVSLLLVRWLVITKGVDAGMLILVVAWLAGVLIMSLVIFPAFWAWKRYGLHYGLLMAASTVLGILVLGFILVVMLIFFGLGLKLLRS